MSNQSYMNEILGSNEVIFQFFDMEDPLCYFKNRLEQLCGISLTDYTIWLQETQQLDESKTLIEHGIQGEGKVQMKLQLLVRDGHAIINILDVLKPTADDDELKSQPEIISTPSQYDYVQCQWVESDEFNKIRKKFNIPTSVEEWGVKEVRIWLDWAKKAFNLPSIDSNLWNITGEDLRYLTHEIYEKIVPFDTDNMFWTHIQLLQECNQVAECLNTSDPNVLPVNVSPADECSRVKWTCNIWTFLLQLLTEKEHKNIIEWTSDEGEFILLQPQAIAKLWGLKKNNENMTYEKMGRAIRTHYPDLLKKVPGRHKYKFMFDVKEVVGYGPLELKTLRNE